MTRPIRFAASGTGRHCRQSHLGPALAAGMYELVAFYDPSPQSCAAVSQMAPEAQAHPSFSSLLDAGAEAIVICGPDDTHLDQAYLAVIAGLHVLVEKPVTVSVDQIGLFRKVMDTAAAQNLVLTSCLPRRVEDSMYPYGWVLSQMPALLGMFGELTSVLLDFSYYRPEVMGTWREGRSLLLDHFPHDGDFAYKVACAAQDGEPLPMRALRLKDDDPLQYAVSGTIGGLPFMCHGSRYELNKSTFAERIVLRFRRGICTVDVSHGEVEQFRFADGKREISRILPINRESGGYDHRSESVMASFATAIQAEMGGGHAYLTADELTMSAEAGPELLESGMYVRR